MTVRVFPGDMSKESTNSPIHVQNPPSNEPAKRPRQRTRNEKIRNPNPQLLPRVPITQKQRHGREQAPLKEPQQNPTSNQAAEILHESRAQAHQAPAERDGGNHAVELEPLDEDGSGEFGDDVEDVEDRYGRLQI